MIKKLVIISTAALLITGCAGTKERIVAFEANRKASEYEMLEARQKVEEVSCKGKEKCDLLFRIASDVILEKSDMKVQNSSQNNISTFNPTQPGRIGISARRTLATGDTEKVIFSAICADRYNAFEELCNKGLSIVYRTYLIKLNEQGFNIK
jgi:hypothetical protein